MIEKIWSITICVSLIVATILLLVFPPSICFGQVAELGTKCLTCPRHYSAVTSAVNIGHSSNAQVGTFFLTCAHGHDSSNNHWLKLGGKKYALRKLGKKMSGPVDLALFFLPGKMLEPCFQVADESPEIGRKAFMVGFPWSRNGSSRRTVGKIEATNINGYEYQFSRPAISGESGSPLFVNDHEIVGIVSHRDGGSSLATNLGPIREFLTSTIGGVPVCRKPKAKETPANPSADIIRLLMRIERLENRINELSKQAGPKGDTGKRGARGLVGVPGASGGKGDAGSAGPGGADGTVTVIVLDSKGNEIGKAEGLKADDVVRLKIDRFLKK